MSIDIIYVDDRHVAETVSGCETPGYACFGCPKQDYCENAYEGVEASEE